MSKLKRAIAIRNKFAQEYTNDSHLIEALCLTLVEVLDNYASEKEWFDTVIFKELDK